MRLVVLASPWRGNSRRNLAFALACLRDCFSRGEAPFASHLLYAASGALDDDVPSAREAGTEAGLAWIEVSDALVVYTNLGLSPGMRAEIDVATRAGIKVEYRALAEQDGSTWASV